MIHLSLFLLVATLQLQNGMVAAGAPGLKTAYLARVVRACWDASIEDAGCEVNREEVTLRLLSAYYAESGFEADKKRLNDNGTHDYGVAQINDVHLRPHGKKPSTFQVWCEARGIRYRPSGIWNLEVNARFGCYVNVLCRRPGGWQYVYKGGGRKDRNVVYRYLERTPDMVKALEGQHWEVGRE